MLGGIFKVRKNALSKYMSVEKSKASKLKVEPGKNYWLADIIDGEVQIDIQNALFRIVCCNRERFQYLESGEAAARVGTEIPGLQWTCALRKNSFSNPSWQSVS
jgi:hypothetical protein